MNEKPAALDVAKTAAPSSRRIAVGPSKPDNGSETTMVMAGLCTFVIEPAAGEARDSTGGTVSSVLNALWNAAVCVFKVRSRAPFATTENVPFRGKGEEGVKTARFGDMKVVAPGSTVEPCLSWIRVAKAVVSESGSEKVRVIDAPTSI